jgi:hypothetical protein
MCRIMRRMSIAVLVTSESGARSGEICGFRVTGAVPYLVEQSPQPNT